MSDCPICEREITETDWGVKNFVQTRVGPIHKICAENAPRVLRELGVRL
jgi:hypothetical protein